MQREVGHERELGCESQAGASSNGVSRLFTQACHASVSVQCHQRNVAVALDSWWWVRSHASLLCTTTMFADVWRLFTRQSLDA